MNDYRTEILLDLRRAVRLIHRDAVDGQQSLHENVGYWLSTVPDVVEQRRWMELFVLELAPLVPGLHEDYLWAAVQGWINDAKGVRP